MGLIDGSHSGGICAVGSRTSNVSTGHYVRPLSSPLLVPADITPYVDRLVTSSPQQSLDVSTRDGFIPDGTVLSIEPEVPSLLSSPYTLPDGSAVQQTQWDFGPSDKVQVSYIPRPDLKPDSDVAPRPDPVFPTPNPNPVDPSAPIEPPVGLCDQYPDILACVKTGDIDKDIPDIPIPEDEITVDLNLNSFSMPAYCPQPRTFEGMGTTFSISYQPFCDFAILLKSLVILMATISAYFIVSKGAD